jgi:uncharacterized membrane protein YkoI
MNRIALIAVSASLAVSTAAVAKDVPPAELEALVKSGAVLPQDKLDAAALAEHPGGTVQPGGEIERHRRGYVYEVEVLDAKGEEWDLDIDAKTGKVLKNQRD